VETVHHNESTYITGLPKADHPYIIVKKPMIYANLMALSFVQLELLAIEVLHCCLFVGIGIFDFFAPVTLSLTQRLSYTNLIYTFWRYTGYANMNLLGLTDI